jgi:hypothetical protein
MEYLYKTVHSIVSWGIDTGINKITTACSNITVRPFINTCILFTFIGLSKMQITCNRFLKVQYVNIENWAKNNWPTLYANLYNCMTVFNHMIKFVYSCIYKHRIEPPELEWSNFSSIDETISDNGITSYNKYSETYNFIQDGQDNASLFNTLYLEATTKQFIQNKSDLNKLLLTVKIDNHYLYRTLHTDSNNKLFELTQSNIKFLSITYTHPSLENSIYIDIPKTALICGNEILSAIFVLRYLEYQSMPYGQFDLNYTINIIDNRVNQFQIRHNQYILLMENEYIIQTM